MKVNPILEKLLDKNYQNDIMLTLLVGASGSGKSTLEGFLEDGGFTTVKSYTTRPQRDRYDYGHIFVSKEEFDKLENKVAYTKFDGYEYCATREQVDKALVYIIDPDGIANLKKLYNTDREIVVIYLDVKSKLRENRMRARGDSEEKVKARLDNDEKVFDIEKIKPDAIINGNGDMTGTLEQFINMYEMLLLNTKLNKLEKEEGICPFVSQDPRLP